MLNTRITKSLNKSKLIEKLKNIKKYSNSEKEELLSFLSEVNKLKNIMESFSRKMYTVPNEDKDKKNMLYKMYLASRRNYLNFINTPENKEKLKRIEQLGLSDSSDKEVKSYSYINWLKLAEYSEQKSMVDYMIDEAYKWKNPSLKGRFGNAIKDFYNGELAFDDLLFLFKQLRDLEVESYEDR